MKEEKRFQVALSLIPNIGPVLSRQLINHFETPEHIFKATKGRISKVPGLGHKLAALIPDQDSLLKKADEVIEKSVNQGIDIHYYREESYPSRLFSINDAPIVLYTKGKMDLNALKIIGIVGTRRATKYGHALTEKIVAEAKTYRPVIVSGLAFGIDIRSHESALNERLPTIAAMACGLDRIYPVRHRAIATDMMENGGLVSEYPVGIRADPRFFPARNRIIAGLSDALIVVEAAKRGGALITANITHSYHKPVFAIPGEIGKSFSEGCNLLIRDMKAGIYTSFQDVVEALNWDVASHNTSQNSKSRYSVLEDNEKKVVNTLLENGQQMHLDQLSWQTQLSLNQLAAVLLQLEFSGVVKSLPGKEFRLS